MKTLWMALLVVSATSLWAQELSYQYVPNWPTLPADRDNLGASHGEIRTAADGKIYVSTETKSMPIGVFNPDGSFDKAIAMGFHGIHGFVIHADPDGVEYIYAAHLRGKQIIKLTLDGELVTKITEADFPADKFKADKKTGKPTLKITSVDVAPNGDIYAVDGYGNDFIYVFDKDGGFKTSFGGHSQEVSGLNNCHKIFIDRRFEPARVLACDRVNLRIVHFSLEGEYLGELATELRRPSSVDFHNDLMVVAEIAGRVVVLDQKNTIVATVSENTTKGEINTLRTPPAKWRDGVVTSPHGICFDNDGNIFVCEWNRFGRILRFDLVK